MKRTMVESASEIHGSLRVGGGNPKTVRWNDQVRKEDAWKEDAWKEELGARDKVAKERCLGFYKEEKRKVKMCIYQSKKEVQE